MKLLNKKLKRITCLLLIVCLLISGIAFPYADETNTEGFSLKLTWEDVNNKSVTISNNKTEFFNHSESNKEIPVRLRISYINEDLMTNNLSYKENELIITVNGLGPALRDGTILPAVSIAADKASSLAKKSNWSYTYTEATDTYTFTNNYPLNSGEPVDGFFEIIWNPDSRKCLNEYNTNITATLRTSTGGEVTSNTVTYSNSYTKDEFDVEITSEGLVTTDGISSLIEPGKTEDDYVWEKYSVYGAFAKVASLGLKNDLTYYKIWFPEDANVYNADLIITDEIKEIEGKNYIAYITNERTILPKDKWGNPFIDSLNGNIYVTYPKENYNPTDKVTVYIDMYGTFNESTQTDELLDSDSVQVNFADNWMIRNPSFGSGGEIDYGFKTIGSFSKYISNHDLQSNKYGAISGDHIKKGGGTAYGELSFKLSYNFTKNNPVSQLSFFNLRDNFEESSVMSINTMSLKETDVSSGDVSVSGNDIIEEPILMASSDENSIVETVDMITVNDFISLMTTDGTLRFLKDEEYSMESIVIPGNLKNLNKLPIEYGVYDCEVYTREANQEWNTVPFKTVKLEENEQKIELPDNTVAVGFVIKDLTTTIEGKFKVNYQLHITEDNIILEEGKFVSGFFGYLISHQDDGTSTTHYYGLSEEEYPYNGDYVNDETHYSRDIETYGRTLFRLTSWNYILRPRSEYGISSNIALDNDVVEGKNTLNMTANIKSVINVQEGADINKFSIYSLLPDETNLFDNINSAQEFLDSVNFNTEGIDSYYLKQHCTIDITKNYKNSGRTLLTFKFDFGDEPVTLNKLSIENIKMYSDDNSNIRYYGNASFRIDSFMIVDDGTGIWYTSTTDNYSGIYKDIDNDGDTSEFVAYGYAVDSTYKAYQGLLSAQKTVSTSTSNGYIKTDYNTENNTYYNVPSTELDGIYSYKLKMTTDSYGISQLLLYDEFEKTNDSTWQGTFEYVDVSNVEKIMGITPTVYYTTKTDLNLNLDNLPNNYKESNDWTTVKPDEKVTAIIVDCGDAILKPLDEVYVEVFLKAPSNREYIGQTTTNIFYTSYYFTNEDGNIVNDSISTVNSNKAAVKLIAPLNKLIIEKIDAETNAHLSNVKFDLYKEDGTLIKEDLTTNDAGMCTITGLEDGNYYIIEKSTQNGYVLDTKKWEITLNNEENPRYVLIISNERVTGSIKLIKISNIETNKQSDNLYAKNDKKYEKLDNAIFNLYKSDGTLLYVEKQDDTYIYTENGNTSDIATINGEIIINGLPWGNNYYLKEVTAPDGYNITEKKYEFEITQNNVSKQQTLVATNKQNPAMVTMTKYEMLEDGTQTTNVIEGAAYALYLKGELGDTFLGTYVTDKNGRVIADNLEFGDYYFIETKAANKYELNAEKIEFSLYSDNYEIEINTNDKRKTGSVNIHKTDAETNEELYNVSFALYKITARNDDGTIKEFYQCDNTGKEVLVPKDGLYYTNTAGNLTINNISWGEYFIQEYEAAIGYMKSDETFEFVIDGSKDKINYSFDITNKQQKGSISLTKVDESDNTILLPNAEFELYNTNDKKINVTKTENEYIVDENGIDILTTNENGIFTLTGLSFGDYYLKETKAPENYGINNDVIRFSVNKINASSIQKLNCEDPQKSMEVTLVKKVKKEDIVDAHGSLVYTIEITDENNNKKSVNLTIDSTQEADEQGYIYSTEKISLPMNGEYTFKELNSNRYKEESMTIEKSDDGSTMIVTFENTKTDQSDTSDSVLIRNLLQPSKKVTGISAIQIGSADDYRLGFKLDDQYIKVYKNFDDGTSEEIPYGSYELSEDTFTINGSYTIYVTYKEGNDVYTDDLYLVINGSDPARLKSWDLSNTANATEFHNSTYESNIINVYFKTTNEVPDNADAVWNVSEDNSVDAYGNATVVAYTIKNADNTYDLYIGQDGGVVSGLNSCAYLFNGMTGLKQIHFIDNENGKIAFDTSKAIVANNMFYNNTSLESLDVSVLDFSNVTNFKAMFEYVGSSNITLGSNFDTSKATNMSYMFDGAKITTLDLGNKFDTTNVTDMQYMFQNCTQLTALDLGDNFNTTNVTNMKYMFAGNKLITTLNLGDNFDTKEVTDMQYMFSGMQTLPTLNLGDKFDTRNVTITKYMFNELKAVKALDLGDNFDTSNVINMHGMFRHLGSVNWSATTLDFGDKFNTTNVKDLSCMFQFSRVNRFEQGWMFDTSNATTLNNMFYMDYALKHADFSHFNMKSATNIAGLLSDTTGCNTVIFGDYMNTNKVTTMTQMFWYNNAKYIDFGPRFSTEELVNANNMFGSSSANDLYLGPNSSFVGVSGNFTNKYSYLSRIYNADERFKTKINAYKSDITYYDNVIYLMNDDGTSYDKVMATTADELPIPTKEGYTFEGWYYAKDAGTVPAVIDGNKVSVPTDLDDKYLPYEMYITESYNRTLTDDSIKAGSNGIVSTITNLNTNEIHSRLWTNSSYSTRMIENWLPVGVYEVSFVKEIEDENKFDMTATISNASVGVMEYTEKAEGELRKELLYAKWIKN